MLAAISQARESPATGDVPVGAVVVHGNKIIARANNRREADRDPTAHAEILALRLAARHLGTWHLVGVTLYVTLEPCPMCAGALVNARVDRLVYGSDDPKAGAVRSLYNLATDPRLNHRLEVVGGVLASECAALLKEFFAGLRAR
jgi:tRNA(adenine34) deaminase